MYHRVLPLQGAMVIGQAAHQLNGLVNVFVDAGNNLYVSEACNNRILTFAADPLTSCVPNLIFTAPSCNGTAIIKRTVLNDTFPAIMAIPEELNLSRGKLNFIGVLNGHCCYKSTLAYPWPVARDVSSILATPA
ncbi:MAG: hypothetical protein ABIQ00_19680 [Chitinophagaceae bacterium]